MKLKRYLTAIIIITGLNSCKGQNNESIKTDTLNMYDKNIDKKAYYLNYDLFMTYDIYLNDIKIISNFQSGPVSGLGYLNEFILNSGTQTIKLVDKDVLPEKTNIPARIFEKFNMEIYSADENDENIENIKKFDFPDIPTPNPYVFEKTWTFEAKVPFDIEGWKNGKDLTKMDEKELEKMVVDKFQHFRKLLNNGDVDQFMEENKKNFEEFVIANYYQKKWNEYKSNIIDLIEDQKGKMLPLENYQMKIYGNGKLVTLERIEVNETYYSRSPLIAIDKKENTLYSNYVWLYMPKNETTLKPVRLNVDYTIADFSKK